MEFSLITGTLGSRPELTRLATSLDESTVESWELILVDQSRDASAKKRLEDHAAWGQVRYERSEPGLSRARNVGLEEATGDIVAFPDDDCWYPEHLLERVQNRFRADPQLDLLAGPYGEPGTPLPSAPDEPQPIDAKNVGRTVRSVGLFARREALEEASLRFDPRLGAGTQLPAAEESDLVYRALAAGLKARYDSRIIVYHPIERESTDDPDTVQARARAGGYVLTRHARSAHPWLALSVINQVAKAAIRALGDPVDRARLKGLLAGIWTQLTEP